MKIVKKIPSLPERADDCHKGSCGKVLVVAGSIGMTGAAVLASFATLRSGAGLVALAIPESLNAIMEPQLTEVITCPMPETPQVSLAKKSYTQIFELAQRSDVVAIGPGLSQNPETIELVTELIKNIEQPIVLDADGINAVHGNTSLLFERSAPTILTPHPGEIAYISDLSIPEVQSRRKGIAPRLAKEWNSIVVLKGKNTVVTDGKNIYINRRV